MALKHGSTTITVLKHGSNTITTGKHGSTTVFTSGSSSPSWHTILSSNFTPEPNQSGQQVCRVSSSATKIQVTTEWYAYNISTQEENYIKEEQQEFSPSETANFTFGASGFGYSEFNFYVNSNHVTVDSSVEEGETGVCYVTVTKVEAYY